jgi:hypothetical protein
VTDSTKEATDRMVTAFRTPGQMFTGEQVAHIVSLMMENDDTELSYRAGWDAGYWARVAEENAAYPPEPFRVRTTVREDAVRVHRGRQGVDSPGPREGDFAGLGMAAVDALKAQDVADAL